MPQITILGVISNTMRLKASKDLSIVGLRLIVMCLDYQHLLQCKKAFVPMAMNVSFNTL
jgi:hypothetical protein